MFLFLIKRIILLIFLINISSSFADQLVKEINVEGNKRVPSETILMFSEVDLEKSLNENDINSITKKLYETNYFSNVSVIFKNNLLLIKVLENPIIYQVKFNGIKSDTLKKKISKNLKLRERSSYNEILLRNDKNLIISQLRREGYFFSKVDIYKEQLEDDKVNIRIEVDLGEKSKIKKISFIGNKIYKNKKLSSIIISEEYKFWKFISGKKYLNESLINFDKKLLRNFYLSKGYYNVEINSSFAKLIGNNEFELIYNINANEKIYFGQLKLILPKDYNQDNFLVINKILNKLSGTPYSINKIEEILEEIDDVVLSEQFESLHASVNEEQVGNKLNLTFSIDESEKLFIERINILGNNVTSENVIRNKLLIDEGDPYNKILATKSINNIKSLNFFRTVKSEVVPGKKNNSKIINISVEEKPTGEIMAGAGVGTSGTSLLFGVKENNFLGKGIGLDANLNLGTDSVKGKFSVKNPNFRNSNKSINFDVLAIETDKLTDFGYKTNKTGFSVGTRFEYYDDFFLNIGTSNFYEKLETDSTASAKQKTQEGDYFDTFLNLNFDYDKRNQKFQTDKGFRTNYGIDLPLISESYTLSNTFRYKYFTELYNDNISTFSFLFKAVNSIKNDDVKLSERLYIPSSSLRGFELGKVGPKDGNDYIGGNLMSSINLTTTLPQVLPNSQNADFLIFMDIANLWGVDYDSSLDDDKIRSSIGVAVDWFTPVGPFTFSLAHPLSKSSNDITESFRFNLGTTF